MPSVNYVLQRYSLFRYGCPCNCLCFRGEKGCGEGGTCSRRGKIEEFKEDILVEMCTNKETKTAFSRYCLGFEKLEDFNEIIRLDEEKEIDGEEGNGEGSQAVKEDEQKAVGKNQEQITAEAIEKEIEKQKKEVEAKLKEKREAGTKQLQRLISKAMKDEKVKPFDCKILEDNI